VIAQVDIRSIFSSFLRLGIDDENGVSLAHALLPRLPAEEIRAVCCAKTWKSLLIRR
jgi:hypothetical protein